MANLDERTEIATQNIAEYLKALMTEKGITAYQLEKMGMPKKQLYSVLRMGDNKSDYTISSFIKVLSLIGVHLEFHDISDKSNFDLINKNSAN